MTEITYITPVKPANAEYNLAVVLPASQLTENNINIYFRNPFEQTKVYPIYFGIPDDGLSRVTLAKLQAEKLAKLLHFLKIKNLYVANTVLFKALTKEKKVITSAGYVFQGKLVNFEDTKIVYGLSPDTLFTSATFKEDLTISICTIIDVVNGTHTPPGNNVSLVLEYPEITPQGLEDTFTTLSHYNKLTCDIETYGLKHHNAGIASIAFGISATRAIALPVDCKPETAQMVRHYLAKFFSECPIEFIFHNACFDAKILKHELEKNPPFQWDFTRTHCTQLIAYLATNNTIKNVLSLKQLAKEYLGNWGREDMGDVANIPVQELLEYNAKDAIATWYVYDKYLPRMVKDNQGSIYQNIMQPAIQTIVEMELNGFPMNPTTVQQVKVDLQTKLVQHEAVLKNSPIIQEFNTKLQVLAQTKRNQKLKTKQIAIEEFKDIVFNPGSDKQIQQLLFAEWQMPIFSKTESGNPSVDGDTLALLSKQCTDPQRLEVIEAIMEINKISVILNTFIAAFEQGVLSSDGCSYLYGNFNLTGTVSSRLSSSSPNMQNLPSKGTIYAKLVKSCFEAPEGWVHCGADFDSLEDKISALTTKDPNKLRVYSEGFNGHCLRAFSYFREQMPDIEDTKESINSIEFKYPKLRQDSKAPTFLLTYGGTHYGLQKNCGFSLEMAMQIEANYHKLYKVSDDWVAEKLKNAASCGFVDVAFGLRVRTPLLARTVTGKGFTPYQAQAEYRTAGNALGQSYCTLNTRAATEFNQRIHAAGMKDRVKLISLIHDAIYLLVEKDPESLLWAKTNLLECMSWQELPELQHDTVKITATFNMYYPTWADEIKSSIPWEDQLKQINCEVL